LAIGDLVNAKETNGCSNSVKISKNQSKISGQTKGGQAMKTAYDKLKILFAVPPYNTFFGCCPPGVGIIATMARDAGYNVECFLPEETTIINNVAISQYNTALIEKISCSKPDIVAIGGMSINYPMLKRLIRLIRQQNVIVVLGGHIVDASPDLVPANIGADYCVYGEGEYTFLELCEYLESNKQAKICSGGALPLSMV
jgi:hypothetical protein